MSALDRSGLRAMRLAFCALALPALLVACGTGEEELRTWMQQQRAGIPIKVTKVEAPKKYEPYRYQSAAQPDPFGAPVIVSRASSTLQPDASRRREVLESFPLDTIRMIGRIASGNREHALLQVGDMVYQARVGNYAGQNHGRITGVTEGEVRLVELVQDAAGDWIERQAVLTLQLAAPQESRK
ncbi:MAG: pilus assembly protein PilP [Quisquiliibacterium sp.]|jgi:type IV pilus assembly protein PilP